MKLTIQDVPPSLNKVLRMHWAKKRALWNDWRCNIRGEMRHVPTMAPLKRRVIIRLCHSRMYDKDNAYGAVKPVVDALKEWALIFNDTAEWLDLTVEQQKCPHKQRHTIIELEPA